MAVVDTAWGGGDSLSMPIAYIYGGDVYIHDWIFDRRDKSCTKPRVVAKIAPENMTLRAYYDSDEYDHFSRIPLYNPTAPEYITGYVLRNDALEELAEDHFRKTLGASHYICRINRLVSGDKNEPFGAVLLCHVGGVARAHYVACF